MSALLWIVSWIHFVIAIPVALVAGAVLGRKRIEKLLLVVSRNVVRCAGARTEARMPPGYDPSRPCIYVSNHVNVFDPFVIHSVIPGPMRGLELESHFKIPFYGWLMNWLGNVPVPEERSAAGLKRTYRIARASLEDGYHIVGFPEGTRTRDGSLGPFEDGVFRMARVLGASIVPISIVGAYRWHPTGTWRLRPGRIVIVVHERIEMAGVERTAIKEMSERVRKIIEGPLTGA